MKSDALIGIFKNNSFSYLYSVHKIKYVCVSAPIGHGLGAVQRQMGLYATLHIDRLSYPIGTKLHEYFTVLLMGLDFICSCVVQNLKSFG